jgi:ferredoxin
MKLLVDLSLCEANGMCTAAAPEVFELDAEDHLHVHHGQVNEAHRAQLEQAVRMCPRAALRLEETK